MKKPTQEQIDALDLFEIYVYNDHTINEGQYENSLPGTISGWEIKWVLATDDGIKSFPWFDCVITKNDTNISGHDPIIWR